MSRYHYVSSGHDEWAAAIVSAVLIALLVLSLVGLYLGVQAVQLVIRACAHHPGHRVLWTALGSTLGCWLLVGVAAGMRAGGELLGGLGTLAIALTGALLLIAQVLEWRDGRLFLRPHTKETLVADVLQRPWWDAA